jgi:hypothetical protein
MEISQSPNTINNNNTEMSNKNDLNGKESHNRNLTIKEIYNIFGPLMITHKLIELDDDFKKYIMLDSISLAQEEKKLISREISDKITAEIKKHDYVFIKLNSKSAIDSEFACVQLKCFNLDEILVLIKASERMYKVFNPYGQNYLILKPWYKIEHKNEFRCYLVNKRLKGISQRYIDSFEDYDDIDKIRECIIEYIFSKEMKDILDKIEIDENDLHYMIIDLVYMPKKNRVKIVDVETLIEGGDILDFNENIETISDNKDMNTIEHKNHNVNPTSNKKDKKKVNSQEMQQEEEAKKLKKEEEEKERKLFMENFANKKINFDEKIKLFTIDDLLNVDDEDESEIELRIIESTDDPRIVPEPENTNKFPIELIEYDNNIDELIKKLNLK